MVDLKPREPVILAEDFEAMVAWYCQVLGFSVARRFEDGFHYANLETPSGIKVGIADAAQMGVAVGDRSTNSVVLQFEVDDVPALCAAVEESGGAITQGPTFNEADGFWFAALADLEGNPSWVVDRNCP